MAWSISITSEGWGEIQEALETWEDETLAAALAADDADRYDYRDLDDLERYEQQRTRFWLEYPHDILVEESFKKIEENDTCDNGGNGYYIDRGGIHQVYLP